MTELMTPDYAQFLADLKTRIRTAQVKATLAVNSELISLYWSIGRDIAERQESHGWGKSVVETLSRDLRREFPHITGVSARNLWDMRRFFLAYRELAENDDEFLRQAVAQIPWGHNLLLLNKLEQPQQRLWYAAQTTENGWSRAVLTYQIETDLHGRQTSELKSHNFARTLPAPDSDLAAQLLKDSYVFDFLSLGPDAKERDLEAGLLEKIRDFLLELGSGFAFMGSQYHLEVGGQDFYVDLLFFHHRLRCLVAIDLKMEDFSPAFVGQLGFYLAVLDDKVRHAQDGPTIGLLLCKSRNRVVVEYALRDAANPLGIADYSHADALPAPAQWEELLASDDENS